MNIAGCDTARELSSNTGGNLQYSTEKVKYSVGSGEGVDNAAFAVEGINDVPYKRVSFDIENDPLNKEVLMKGLRPGDVLYIPKWVKK
jgi:hypothetical protein